MIVLHASTLPRLGWKPRLGKANVDGSHVSTHSLNLDLHSSWLLLSFGKYAKLHHLLKLSEGDTRLYIASTFNPCTSVPEAKRYSLCGPCLGLEGLWQNIDIWGGRDKKLLSTVTTKMYWKGYVIIFQHTETWNHLFQAFLLTFSLSKTMSEFKCSLLLLRD